ncbi:TPA: hypothetical protein RFT53_002616 [Klebsiella aerogenes]|uniref:hypothetical protein n=1 Tax=Klebsiella aerogenes TaxID=548 RepID=UPI001F2BFF6B|nr:hypothetical protein [Klebsiella aerogenes]HDU4641307.1 hypothetical protein [Klebsiella aerogenes]
MTAKKNLKMLSVLTLVAVCGLFFLFASRSETQVSSNDSEHNDKRYVMSVNHLRDEITQLNQNSVGKQIFKNTRLDCASLNEEDKVAVYELTLLDVSLSDINLVSRSRKAELKKVVKQNLIQKINAEGQSVPLFEHGWSMEYIQKTNDGYVISDITIRAGDLSLTERHDVI